MVDGLQEIWQLRWAAKPHEVCEPSQLSLTCPCEGFAYGEGGELDLVRLRESKEVDRLHITPLFEEQISGTGQVAIIQRWQPDHERDFAAARRTDFPQIVRKRRTVQIMHFDDYDHDGRRNEFYLQTESAPCGKSVGVVIGVSKTNAHIHAFGTASKPDKPLYMQKREWEALRDAFGPIEIVEWQCGDHAAETQTILRLNWTTAGIEGSRREFECDANDKPGRLIREESI